MTFVCVNCQFVYVRSPGSKKADDNVLCQDQLLQLHSWLWREKKLTESFAVTGRLFFFTKLTLKQGEDWSEMPCSSFDDHRSTMCVNCRKSQKSRAALVYSMQQRVYPTELCPQSTDHKITRSINLLDLEMMNQIKTKPDTKHTLKLQKYTEKISQQPGFCCMRFGLLPRNNAVWWKELIFQKIRRSKQKEQLERTVSLRTTPFSPRLKRTSGDLRPRINELSLCNWAYQASSAPSRANATGYKVVVCSR